MPFVFGASAAASAAGAALLAVPSDEAEPARALGIAAVVVEEVTSKVMLKRLGPQLASAYEEGTAGRLDKVARGLSGAGAVALALGGRRGPGDNSTHRRVSAAGGALLLAGAVCKRWAIFKAGFASAADPHQTVDLQRERMAREGGGA
jgi:hypothetical protein